MEENPNSYFFSLNYVVIFVWFFFKGETSYPQQNWDLNVILNVILNFAL